MTRQAMYV